MAVAAALIAPSPSQAQIKKQIALMPLRTTADTASLGEACDKASRAEVARIDTVSLLDDTELAARLDLEGIATPGCRIDSECIIINGEKIGVDSVIFGSLSREGDQVSATLKLYSEKEHKEDRTFAAKLIGEPLEIAGIMSKAAVALVTGGPFPETAQVAPPPIAGQQQGGPGSAQTQTGRTIEPEHKKRLWTWVSLGGELAFLALGIGFNVGWYQMDKDIHSGHHSTKELDSMISKGNAYYITSWVFYGLAVAAAGSTIFFAWWESPREQASAKLGIKELEPIAAIDPEGKAGFFGLGGRF
jgi:hypothetical protein